MPEKPRLTVKDLKILSELDFNARISENKLARRTALSKVTVRYRLARLERLGVIKRYFIVANAPLRGLISTKVMLKYQKANEEIDRKILSFLEEREEVGWIVETDGAFNLMFYAWTKSIFDFEKFYNEFLDNFSESFIKREIMVVSEHSVFNKKYLVEGSEVKGVSYSGEPNCIVDETDLKIVDELRKNSRTKTVELSKVVGLTPEAVMYRIKKLEEKGVIQAYRAMIDLEKIGYLFYNVVLKLRVTSTIPAISGFCR